MSYILLLAFVTITYQCNIPSVTNIVATEISLNYINISWSQPDLKGHNLVTYQVYWSKKVLYPSWSSLTTNITSATISNLITYNSWMFKIRTMTTCNSSYTEFSNILNVTIPYSTCPNGYYIRSISPIICTKIIDCPEGYYMSSVDRCTPVVASGYVARIGVYCHFKILCWRYQYDGFYNVSLPSDGNNEVSYVTATHSSSPDGSSMIDIEILQTGATFYINGTSYLATISTCGTGYSGACALHEGSSYAICTETKGISRTLYLYPYCNAILYDRWLY